MKKKTTKKGRPPLFKNKEELRSKINEYLADCNVRKFMPNVAGFCVFIGIHRDSFYEYKKKKSFSDTIKELMSSIEDSWIQRLAGPNATGSIFYLKNAFKDEYKDRQETDITSKGEQIHIYVPERK